MRLTVITPLAIAADCDSVAHVRAEDDTGAFGILPGHADFLTALSVSVVTWRDQESVEHHIAVRGGVLEVRQGKIVSIATREAISGDDLRWLETEVLGRFRGRIDEEQQSRTDAQKLYLAAIRQIYHLLRPEQAGAAFVGSAASKGFGGDGGA